MTEERSESGTSGSASWPRAGSWPWILLALAVMVVLGTWTARTFYGPRASRLYELSGATMGTTWHLRMALPDGSPHPWVEAIGDTVQARLDRVERLMSTWDSTSELSRFNRDTSDIDFALSPETIEVLEIALDVSRRSAGAFDVTVGPLVTAWGFGSGVSESPGSAPSAAELERLRSRVGFHLLRVDSRRGTAGKERPGLELDLSSVAKGYALDLAADGVRRMGAAGFALEVGGEVEARGSRPDGSAWRVAVEAPTPEARSVLRVLELRDEAVATSGDYRNFVIIDGRRYGHIIDPRSGRPVPWRGFSVSVLHREAARADAWATALSVLGPDDGLALADSLGIQALFVVPSAGGGFEELRTPRLGARLEP